MTRIDGCSAHSTLLTAANSCTARYKAWSIAVRKAGIDDPLDAGAVHLGAGAWGLVAVTMFAVPKESPLSSFGTPSGLSIGGIFYDAEDRCV